ncbi:hypothetical protein LguiA_013775 [Lonicera macranthoides]
MNLQKAEEICSSIPLLGCVLGALFRIFSSSDDDDLNSNANLEDKKIDRAVVANIAAQKHFTELQSIRGP